MNYGGNRGDARGFRLAFLQKLQDTRTQDGKATLLSYVAKCVVLQALAESQAQDAHQGEQDGHGDTYNPAATKGAAAQAGSEEQRAEGVGGTVPISLG